MHRRCFKLHWLPVSLSIDHKILLLILKCIYGLAPTYLSDLISLTSNSSYNLSSTGKLLLDHPKGKRLIALGARSFSAAAPKLLNGLPVELCKVTSKGFYVVGVHTSPPRMSYFSFLYFMPFTQGLVCHEKQFPAGVPKQMIV